MSRGATYGKTQQQHPQQQQSSSGDGGRGRTSYADDDEDDPNNENDEDHTARLSLDRRRSAKTTLPPDDNVSALARVKNLTQRNRMVSYLYLRLICKLIEHILFPTSFCQFFVYNNVINAALIFGVYYSI